MKKNPSQLFGLSVLIAGIAVSGEVVKHSMSEIKPEAVFSMPGGAPDWMVITKDAVWVSDSPKNSVYRLDPHTNKIAATIEVGSHPCSGITAGAESVWVPVCGDHILARIDMQSNKVTARLPVSVADSEGGIGFGDGSVWVLTDKKGILSRIDPTKNAVIATVTVPSESFACTYGEGAVWVTSTGTSQLARVDPKTNKVTQVVKVGLNPRFLTVGAGSIWTLNQGDGTISRVDAGSARLIANIPAGLAGPGGEIAYGEDAVWVTLFQTPITRIDPSTNSVAAKWVGPGGDSIRVGFGSIWLTNLKEHNLWRLKPGGQ